MESGKGKIILLDRDGVLNRDVHSSVRSVEEFQLYPDSLEALRLLTAAGYRVIVITNQACIGRGDVAMDVVEHIHGMMCRHVAERGGEIADIFLCPHSAEEGCTCRKPLPGLIEQAQEKWQFISEHTWFVGDAKRDIDAAVAAGCRPALVRTGHGVDTEKEVDNIPVFDDLLTFVRCLLDPHSLL